MPELAEVEFYRRQWDAGIGDRIKAVHLHAGKRIFRGTNTRRLRQHLNGARLLRSEARGKQMLFEFSDANWVGVHLGMSGALRIEPPDFQPGKHDHLVLRQPRRCLVFSDPRQFGRIRFAHEQACPPWWPAEACQIGDSGFASFFRTFIERHRRAPIKAVLLRQDGFPGIGNWMADEILWRSRLDPRRSAADLNDGKLSTLLRETRAVARASLRTIGKGAADLPRGWLIHQRWKAKGVCPKHRSQLTRATVGGRTTAWCAHCQR